MNKPLHKTEDIEIDLFVKCPTCIETQPAVQWHCSGCNAICKLSDQGFIRCSQNCFKRFIQHTRFLCNTNSHTNEANFYKTATDFIYALQSAVLAVKLSKTLDGSSIGAFVVKITNNIFKQWKE